MYRRLGNVYSNAKWLFLLYVLILEADDSVHKPEVAEYFLERRKYEGDVFGISFNGNYSDDHCSGTELGKFCSNLSAFFHNGPLCLCSCSHSLNTFLPDLGKCVNGMEAVKHFKGCTNYFSDRGWDTQLFMKTVIDFKVNGSQPIPNQYKNCEVVPGTLAYYSFGSKLPWQKITKEIFYFRKTNGELAWTATKDVELSGRIIRVNITCGKGGEITRENGCILVKSVGNVTYCRNGTQFAYSTKCLAIVKSSTMLPSSALLLSSLSSSLLPPVAVTRTGYPTPTVLPTFIQDNESSPSPSTVNPHITSSVIPFVTPSTKVNVNTQETEYSQKTLNQVTASSSSSFATVIPPLRPSQSLPISTSATLSPADQHPKGGTDTQKGENNGAIIGAAVGATVVFAAVLIIALVFCRRRRKQPKNNTCKMPQEVKNQVYGRTDNVIHMTITGAQRQTVPCNEQHDSPVYQSLVKDRGGEADREYYISPEGNYDNHPVYQSLEKQGEQKGNPVYQSLQKGPQEPEYTYAQTPGPIGDQRKCSRGPLGPVLIKEPRGSRASKDPMDIVPKEPDSCQDYEDPEMVHGARDTQEPLYVLEDDVSNSSDSETDPTYNVLDNPDSGLDVKNEPNGLESTQEPLYNLLEHCTPEGSHSMTDPLYNVLDGPDVGTYEPVKVGFPEKPISSGLQNPSYELTEEFETPQYPQYASLGGPSPPGESLYQPLKGP